MFGRKRKSYAFFYFKNFWNCFQIERVILKLIGWIEEINYDQFLKAILIRFRGFRELYLVSLRYLYYYARYSL